MEPGNGRLPDYFPLERRLRRSVLAKALLEAARKAGDQP